ncbi:MAG: serpin family protein [Planctomycetes bacterium]|nr:serpin family protein [Planctomycetota bacterium]
MRVVRIGWVVLGAAVATWCGCSRLSPQVPHTVDPRTTHAVAIAEQRLALRLLDRLCADAPGANVLIGPDSILSAMTLAASGAAGETRAQLLGALGFDPALDAPLEAVAAMQRALAAAADDVELSIDHRLWIDESQRLTEAWRSRVDASFEHAFESVDFAGEPNAAREAINEFVADATDDKIVDLMPPGSIDGLTRLVISNAVWFKGRWAHPFDPDRTRPGTFTKRDRSTVEVPMMSMKAMVGFAETDTDVVVELPYEGDELAMLIVLPNDAARIGEWPADAFDRHAARLVQREVHVIVPRFAFRGRYALVDAFVGLGATDAFDQSRADFSAMEERRELFVSGVFHQSFIVVDEEGTEAAAATGVAMALKSAVDRTPSFRADRPFVFAIRHRASGAILFAGVVEDPSKS